ncbi:MAG: hypothetical protein K2G03_05615, partial [Bacilli bacterium]|nr:hypothetical protein [Bacilli bacterium]
VYAVIILIFVFIILIGLLNLFSKKRKLILIILIWLVSLGLLCGPVLFFVLAFAYTPEKVVDLEGKTYVAVVKSFLHADVYYYDYYGPFIMGTKLRVHGDFGSGKFNPILEEELASKIVYTFYDEDGNIEDTLVKKEEKHLVKQEDEEEKKQEVVKPSEEEILLPQDAEVLYEYKKDNHILRFVNVDYAMGQNQLISVVESLDNGRTFNWKTKGAIQVSNEAKFIFLDENIGFAINTGKVQLDWSKTAIYVTNDGGETLKDSEFIYNTDRKDTLDIDGFPYMEDGNLKIKCLEYINKYEDKELIFASKDKGKT